MADDSIDKSTSTATESAASSTPASGDKTATPRRQRRRSKHADKDLTKGSIPKNLWFLAWPQIAESFLSVVDQLADLVWAGRLGFHAIAGLGVAQTFLMMTMTARMGLDAGMRSMISRAVGAKNIAYANHVMLQALTLTTVYSVLVVTLGIIFAAPLLRF